MVLDAVVYYYYSDGLLHYSDDIVNSEVKMYAYI